MEQKSSKKLKILAVCGMGLGSGLVLKMTLEKAIKEMGINASVEVADVASATTMATDLVVTSYEFANSFFQKGIKVITIKNYTNVNEMKEKLQEALKES
ncbi:PTS sugar transporter subunit IIB [Caldisericum exile]|uniref:Phosphotransferase system enzyme IIB component n=1 Tax=Caldisericum exile (strain DSM 21853 / NBRC 104410 / AZM16c01) TaxID=511051 RepID=A0A7U6GFR4_CALEA|nr:PTS sugar transporter subunit IIB [Caldisericum exile]BAL81578.1 putative phosphotransferase system enzyme IIB component [Caldisericum exile AZM16c01]